MFSVSVNRRDFVLLVESPEETSRLLVPQHFVEILQTVLDDRFELSGDATGWGVNFSSNLKATPSDTVRLQFIFGEGIQNYMNDSPVDVGIVNNFSNPVTPILGEAVPIIGIVAFLDHNWNQRFSTAVGYSLQDNDNTEGQAPNAFKTGHLRVVLRSP